MYICALRTSAYKINIKEWNMQKNNEKSCCTAYYPQEKQSVSLRIENFLLTLRAKFN